MTESQVVDMLRRDRDRLGPADLARLLDDPAVGRLTFLVFFKYFRAAFDVPLRVLYGAAHWKEFGLGMMSDHDFNQLLGPWISGSNRHE